MWGAVGVLISACLPAAWIGSEVLERVGPGRSQATAVLHVARCGIGIGALALLCVMGPHGEEGRGALAVAWVGVLLFMTEPANQVVNAVLVLAGVPASEGVAPRKRERAGDSGQSADHALRGGHWIGALERLLLILLAMAGAEIPAAVIVAAKGVVRFPEISKPGGRAAEIFLIGSMTSWTLAVLGIALLRAL